MFSPSNKEIENVIRLEPFERYRHALKNIAGYELIYALEEDEDHYLLLEGGGRIMLSVWPAAVYAERCLKVFGGVKVVEVELEQFQDNLAIMEPADLLLNVFSVDGRAGFVVNREEFLRDLGEELERYE